jgi:hypothetical protein
VKDLEFVAGVASQPLQLFQNQRERYWTISRQSCPNRFKAAWIPWAITRSPEG